MSILIAGSAAHAQQFVLADRYVVTSGHPDATAAGLALLRDGGNVVDAAVATSLCLGVAEPYGSGMGGKGMLLYREAASGKVFSVEAMCQAPAALKAAHFAARGRRERYYGYTSVAVPGLLAALDSVHRRWGSKSWRELVLPAADLAERGVVMTEKMFQLSRPKRNLLRRDAEAARLYLLDRETPPVGSTVKNPELARSLKRIAAQGPAEFYDGKIAERIVAAARASGSTLSRADFRAYRPTWGVPLHIHYDEYEIYSSPPPLTGGITVLATLKALDGVAALETTAGRDSHYIDLAGRALLALYPRINRTVADASKAFRDATRLLENETASEIRHEAAELGPSRPFEPLVPSRSNEATAEDRADSSTSHLIVADQDGNIVCLTQSLSYHFGSCVIAPGTGFFLNNSMSNFSTGDPEGVNYVAPGKRERSTIAPVIATRNGQPALAMGIPGGQRIPTTTIQILLDYLHFGTPLEDSFARSRFHVRRPVGTDQDPNVVDLEENAPAQLDPQLKRLGWQAVRHKQDGTYFGGGSAVEYQTDSRLKAVADLRRTNFANGD